MITPKCGNIGIACFLFVRDWMKWQCLSGLAHVLVLKFDGKRPLAAWTPRAPVSFERIGFSPLLHRHMEPVINGSANCHPARLVEATT